MLVAVLAAAWVLVWLAPEERTLGPGIKPVYVHVALTLTGMLGLVVSGLLGCVALLTAHRGSLAWTLATGRVALLLYAAGVATSIGAAWVNWGGVLLGEPILRSSLLLLGFTLLAHAAVPLLPSVRPQAALGIVPLLALLLGTAAGTPLIMHPAGPVLGTSPRPILLTFAGLTALCLVAGARASRELRRRLDA